jgi:hypothetical protein
LWHYELKPRQSSQGKQKPKEGIIMENITRSKILGRSVILRKRKILSKPFSYNQGECYHNLTGGLWSLYIEHKKGRPVNVSIDDR